MSVGISRYKHLLMESPPHFYVSLASCENFSLQSAIDLLESAYDNFLRPLAENRNDLKMVASYSNSDSDRFVHFKDDTVNWKLLRTKDRLNHFALSHWRETNKSLDRSPSVSGLALNWPNQPDEARSIEISISSLDMLNGVIDLPFQQKITQFAKEAFIGMKGSVGYSTIDYVSANCYGAASPYEMYVVLSYPWAAKEFRAKARGYYWGNFLHQRHIDQLGGVEALAHASMVKIEKLDSERYYLQLTDDINDIPLTQLHHLKTVFSKILPVGYPSSRSYGKVAVPYFL